MRNYFLGLLFFVIIIPAASAQQVRLLSSEAPHYIGVPVDIQISAEGFAETPQPQIQVPSPTAGTLEFLGVSPSVNTSIKIINGRMTQSKIVRFNFNYRFVAQRSGRYQIGPFTLSQAGQQATTGTLELTISDIPQAGNQHLTIVLPGEKLYVGQRARLSVEWWLEANLQNKLYNHRVHLPMLTKRRDFRIESAPDQSNNTELNIDTDSGAQRFPATARTAEYQRQSYIVIASAFIITPLKAGDYELEPASLSVDEAVRWRRNLFGDRVPTHAQKRRAMSTPIQLTVAQVPAQGKPESFAGAIGSGFSLALSADRSVVQVGDPIKLTLTLRGDTTLETLALPALEKLGLPAASFSQAEGESTGKYQDGQKVFQQTVRVLSADVDAIPPLSFSWFDPLQESYQTTQSQPIALSVRQAQVVSASDVVSSANEASSAEAPTTDISTEPDASDPVKPRFSLSGAELSIEQDLNKLSSAASGWLNTSVIQSLCYGGGLLILALAFWLRRRADADPILSQHLKDLTAQSQRIANAKTVAETAAAIRRLAAAANTFPRTEYDALLAECDAKVYAPGGASAPVDAALQQRAISFANAILDAR